MSEFFLNIELGIQMSEKTKIEWCDRTFSYWEGCEKVSPGCKNCYAETLNKRWRKGANWGKGAPRRKNSEATLGNLKRWNREAERTGERISVFNSMNDWLDDAVPIEWLAEWLDLINEWPENLMVRQFPKKLGGHGV